MDHIDARPSNHEQSIKEAESKDQGDDRYNGEDEAEAPERLYPCPEQRRDRAERCDSRCEDGAGSGEEGCARLEVSLPHERVFEGERDVDKVVDGEPDNDRERERLDGSERDACEVQQAHHDQDRAKDAVERRVADGDVLDEEEDRAHAESRRQQHRARDAGQESLQRRQRLPRSAHHKPRMKHGLVCFWQQLAHSLRRRGAHRQRQAFEPAFPRPDVLVHHFRLVEQRAASRRQLGAPVLPEPCDAAVQGKADARPQARIFSNELRNSGVKVSLGYRPLAVRRRGIRGDVAAQRAHQALWRERRVVLRVNWSRLGFKLVAHEQKLVLRGCRGRVPAGVDLRKFLAASAVPFKAVGDCRGTDTALHAPDNVTKLRLAEWRLVCAGGGAAERRAAEGNEVPSDDEHRCAERGQ
mmetsp:Transcript_58481/g.127023  ORF Transcript_58481/g.127023 Transcript_58481/m.127023 type:complete len:412 (+) Transcript_58481:466-1701(+)|eukprot:6044029-Pleurochrysis_carterae.AAC.1